MDSIQVDDYFKKLERPPIIDVRTPKEYAKGHIPGAINLPLFDDNERAEVGILYKHQGKDAAVLKGLDIAGGKMRKMVEEAVLKTKNKEVVIHCWRGGMRSKSVASLLSFIGKKASVLNGGYKAYRNFVLNGFENKKFKIIILGGKTGSGKTEMLHHLANAGEQMIDLEDLAHHKGSAFGALGELPQPTVEQFENLLFDKLLQVDPAKRLWLENESRSIGRVFIPVGFWDQMCNGLYIRVDVPIGKRAENLVKLYGGFPKDEIIESITKIQKRMGGQHVKAAIAAFNEGNLLSATKIALAYYDKAYEHASNKKDFLKEIYTEVSVSNMEQIAKSLIKIADEQNY